MTTDRARLLRWLGWFAAANALLAALIGLWYLRFYGWPGSWLGAGYLLLAWAGHYAVLVAVPILLLGGAWILVAPRRATVIGSTLLLGTAMLTLLALDAWVFGNNRFHLTTLTLGLNHPSRGALRLVAHEQHIMTSITQHGFQVINDSPARTHTAGSNHHRRPGAVRQMAHHTQVGVVAIYRQ